MHTLPGEDAQPEAYDSRTPCRWGDANDAPALEAASREAVPMWPGLWGFGIRIVGFRGLGLFLGV